MKMKVLYEIVNDKVREKTWTDDEWRALTEGERVRVLAVHGDAVATLNVVRNRLEW